jgi:DNA-directed RNA polymerase specialized sigma24 family protein
MAAAAATLDRRSERAARTRTGDGETFVALYKPDFGGVFDLVLRTVRDRETAVAVLRAALDRAWDAFRGEGAPYDVSGWLYTMARESALETPAKRRAAPTDREGLDYTQVDAGRLSDPTAAFDDGLIELVWDAASALDRDDYSLLDLHVRRDLSVDELAGHLDQQRDELAGRLSRLCNSLNDVVSATLLATRARHNCAALDSDLSASGSTVRRTVSRHVSRCTGCWETKHLFVPATEVLGSFASMVPPPGLEAQVAHGFLRGERRRKFSPRRGSLL